MFKINMTCILGAFLLVIGTNLSLVGSTCLLPEPQISVDFIDDFVNIGSTLSCLAHSCDCTALAKGQKIKDLLDIQLKCRVPKCTLKWILATTLSKLQKIDPNCCDTSYSCPCKETEIIPDYIEDLFHSMGSFLASTSCITSENGGEAAKIFGKSVKCLRKCDNTSENSVMRFKEAIDLASQGLKDMCARCPVSHCEWIPNKSTKCAGIVKKRSATCAKNKCY